MNFFEQMITAIYKFQSYPKLIMQKFGKVLCYLLIFTLIIAIVNAIPFIVGYKKIGGFSGAIKKYVPEFSIENGKFQCETVDYTDEIMGVKIYIDDNEDVSDIDVGNFSFYLIADSDKMIISNGIQKQVIEFSQFKNDNFNKSMLIDLFSNKKVKIAIFTIFSITTLFSLCFSTLFGLLVLSLLSVLINVCLIHADIRYTDILKLSVYARTFPSILLIIISLSGFAGGSILYWGLLITYIYLGLKNIKKQEAIIIAEF